MKKVFALVISAILLAGCAGTNFSWDNARQIKQGMNEQEVLTLLGKPNLTKSSPEGLVYVWSFANGLTGSVRTVSVVMKDGVVVSAPVIPAGY